MADQWAAKYLLQTRLIPSIVQMISQFAREIYAESVSPGRRFLRLQITPGFFRIQLLCAVRGRWLGARQLGFALVGETSLVPAFSSFAQGAWSRGLCVSQFDSSSYLGAP